MAIKREKKKKDEELRGKENKWVRMENMSFTQTQILCMFIGSGNDMWGSVGL